MKGYLATLLLYLLSVGQGVSKERVFEVAKTSREDKVISDVMTGAEMLREEGKVEGLSQGLAQGLLRGKEQGLEQGQLIGKIIFIQESLGREISKAGELEQQSLSQLKQELEKLRSEWLKQIRTN